MGVLGVLAVHVALGLASDPPSPPVEKNLPTLLVLPLTARAGIPVAEVAILSDFMAAQARRIPGYHTVSMADVETMVSVETRAQLAGCEATSCLAEIGGALQAEEVLTGTLGRLGERELVLTVNRISPSRATALAGESERIIGGGEDAAIDGVARVLHRLYDAYQPPKPRVKPLPRSLIMGLITGVGAAVQYAAFASMFTSTIFLPCPLVMVGLFGASAAACCAAPIYTSAIQVWLMDFVGRRQAGFRYAMWVGLGLLALDGVLGVAISLACASIGFLAGLLGPDQITARNQRAENLWRLIIPITGNLPLNFAVLGAFVGLWTGVLGLITLVPFGQAVTVLLMSRERSPDVEPQRPTLYAIFEHPPGWLCWIPSRILGGAPVDTVPTRSALEPETPPTPATPPAPTSPPAE